MGVLSWELKQAHLAERMSPPKPTKQQVRKAFYKADSDGNGKLTVEEFKVAMLELVDDPKTKKGMKKDMKNKDMMEMIISSIDSDGDSMISLEEFFVMLDCDKEGNEKQMFLNLVRSADKNKDGFISAKEMKELSKKMGGGMFEKEEDFKILLMMADLDGDRKISIEEMAGVFTDEPKKRDPKDEAKAMFRMCDIDGDGFISKKEIVKFFKIMDLVSDEDDPQLKMMINMVMAEADKDKDGKLNYKEFCAVLDKN